VNVVHWLLTFDHAERAGQTYCGRRARYFASREFLEFGERMLATTAVCEVTCEKCRRFRKENYNGSTE
jgi:hypothetical protein